MNWVVPLLHRYTRARIFLACPFPFRVCTMSAMPFPASRFVRIWIFLGSRLHRFGGADRRFQYKGKFHGATVIDDYAHHPTEIRASLSAAQNYPHERIICVFQPHTYTRTKAFLSDFADALSLADVVVLADIYAAREQDIYGVSSKDILRLLEEKQVEAYYFPSFAEIEDFLREKCMNGDLLITMGAGNVVNIGEDLLK